MKEKNQGQLIEKLLLQDTIIVVKEIPDEELAKQGEVNILAVFMKYGDNPNFPQWLIDHPDIAQQLGENRYIEHAIEYLLEVGDHKEEDLLAAFEKTSNKLKETMLTTRQRIEKRGIEQGMREGEHNKALAIARHMLFQLQLGLDVVAKTTGLSKEELEQLQKDKHRP